MLTETRGPVFLEFPNHLGNIVLYQAMIYALKAVVGTCAQNNDT